MRAINVSGMPPNSPGIVYCGRKCAGWQESPLGNPCSKPEKPCLVCSRVHFGKGMVQLTECRSIECYRRRLWERIRVNDRVVLDALGDLREGDLPGCWCLPKPCHLEVVIKAWEYCRNRGYFLASADNGG